MYNTQCIWRKRKESLLVLHNVACKNKSTSKVGSRKGLRFANECTEKQVDKPIMGIIS